MVVPLNTLAHTRMLQFSHAEPSRSHTQPMLEMTVN
jgi:hypothetical protein